MARKLRIAVTVFFGLVTLALCLIWVRSYRFNEAFSRISAGNVPPGPQWSDIRITSIGWNRGRFYAVNTFVHRLSTRIAPHGWRYNFVLYQHPMSARPDQRFFVQEYVLTDTSGKFAQSWLPLPYVRWLPRGFCFKPNGICVRIWSLVSISVSVPALLWLSQLMQVRYYFSLRSLFIVTTLLAIGLGLAVWAAR
jgi:hypothetical protein